MDENFDWTQFITFDADDKFKVDDIYNIYKDTNIKILRDDEIREVKRKYFKSYIKEYFIELYHDNFQEYLARWKVMEDVPHEIESFSEKLKQVI